MTGFDKQVDLDETSILQVYQKLGLTDEGVRSKYLEMAPKDRRCEKPRFAIITTNNSKKIRKEELF